MGRTTANTSNAQGTSGNLIQLSKKGSKGASSRPPVSQQKVTNVPVMLSGIKVTNDGNLHRSCKNV